MSESHSSGAEAAKTLLDLKAGVVDIARKKKLPPPRYSPLRTLKRRNCGPEKSICKVQREKYCVSKQPTGTYVRPRMFRTPQGNRCITGFRVCPNKNCYPSRWFSGKNDGSPQTAAYIRNYERMIQNPANRASILATLRRKQFLGPPAVRPSPRDPETIREGRESESGQLYSPGRDGSLSDYESNDSANYSDLESDIDNDDGDDDNDDDDDADANIDKDEDKDVVNDDDISTEKQKTKNKLKRLFKLKAHSLKKAAQAVVYYKNMISKFKRSKSFQEKDNKELYEAKLKDISVKVDDLKNSLESFKNTRLPSKKYNRKIEGRVENKLEALKVLKSELEGTKKKDETAKRKTRESRRLVKNKEGEESPPSPRVPSPAPSPALPALPALPAPALPAPGLPVPSPAPTPPRGDSPERDDDYGDETRFDDDKKPETTNNLYDLQRSSIEKARQDIEGYRSEQTKLNSQISEDSRKMLQQMLESIDGIVNKFEKNKDPSKEEIESFVTLTEGNNKSIDEFILKITEEDEARSAVSNIKSAANKKREEAKAAAAKKKADAKLAQEAESAARLDKTTQEESSKSREIAEEPGISSIRTPSFADRKNKESRDKNDARLLGEEEIERFNRQTPFGQLLKENDNVFFKKGKAERLEAQKFQSVRNKFGFANAALIASRKRASEATAKTKKAEKEAAKAAQVAEKAKGEAQRVAAEALKTPGQLHPLAKKKYANQLQTRKVQKANAKAAETAKAAKMANTEAEKAADDEVEAIQKAETESGIDLADRFKNLNISPQKKPQEKTEEKAQKLSLYIEKFKEEIENLVEECRGINFDVGEISEKYREAYENIVGEKNYVLHNLSKELGGLDYRIVSAKTPAAFERIKESYELSLRILMKHHNDLKKIVQKNNKEIKLKPNTSLRDASLDSLQQLSVANNSVTYTGKAIPKGKNEEKHIAYASAATADDFARIGRQYNANVKSDAKYLFDNSQIDKQSRDNVYAAVDRFEDTSSESSNSNKTVTAKKSKKETKKKNEKSPEDIQRKSVRNKSTEGRQTRSNTKGKPKPK